VCIPFEHDEPFERIYHLASPASVVDYLAHPLETLAVNATGTGIMLDLARRNGARLLFTSTSEIYGDPLIHPQSETYWGNVNPVGIRSCYDEAKRYGEALVLAHWRTHGTDARIVRIFNTYGPHSRADDGRIVPNFITQALHGLPITIYGDGSQTRSFCYVSDLVRGLIMTMESTGTAGEVINLGNPEELTVLRFAEIIAAHVGSDAGVIFRPLPEDDPTRRRPDITKARTLLGWEPLVSVREGLDRTVEWFRHSRARSPTAV
jgi:nucleoside-diphosphate-sugar epimerase